jgi:hypothetical protein
MNKKHGVLVDSALEKYSPQGKCVVFPNNSCGNGRWVL